MWTVGGFDQRPGIALIVSGVGTIIVSTPQDVALADVRRGIAMFRKISVPVGITFPKNLFLNQVLMKFIPFALRRSLVWY